MYHGCKTNPILRGNASGANRCYVVVHCCGQRGGGLRDVPTALLPMFFIFINQRNYLRVVRMWLFRRVRWQFLQMWIGGISDRVKFHGHFLCFWCTPLLRWIIYRKENVYLGFELLERIKQLSRYCNFVSYNINDDYYKEKADPVGATFCYFYRIAVKTLPVLF